VEQAMRVRFAYLAVLLTGFALIGVALQGMARVDTTLRVAATTSQPAQHPCHEHDDGV
jgi:hypothetical protein